MNNSYSLYKIIDKEQYPFSASDYSWFKFGDTFFASNFAADLFDGFIKQYGHTLLSQEDIIILPSPYLAIPTASNFLCHFFKKRLDSFLFKNARNSSIESKIYRNQTYVTDYGNLDFEQRIKLISNDTYYIDREFIQNKFCIFLDDIKITGSHELTVNNILREYNVSGNFLFVYLAELINKSIHPSIENHYNYFSVKGPTEIIQIMNRITFRFNTRIVKYILSLNTEDFISIISNISGELRQELFHLAISNNYHQITAYRNNIDGILAYTTTTKFNYQPT